MEPSKTTDSSGFFMVLVALQVGIQPAVTKACVRQAVSGFSLVIAELVLSMALAVAVVPPEAFVDWSFLESAWLAGPPAAVYALRSLLKQAAYRLCDGVTFNIVNQTKVVFCAIAAWVLLGEGQTRQQCAAAVSAGGLLISGPSSNSGGSSSISTSKTTSAHRLAWALGVGNCKRWYQSLSRLLKQPLKGEPACKDEVAEAEHVETALEEHASHSHCRTRDSSVCARRSETEEHTKPATPTVATTMSGTSLAFATAACSGLGAALSQAAMAGKARPSALFNLELALWGLPLVVFTGFGSNPRTAFRGWHLWTVAPVAMQAAGGLLVSAVVKQRGGVAMGLCTVAGIAVSAMVDACRTQRCLSVRQLMSAGLCALSVAVHQVTHENKTQGGLSPSPPIYIFKNGTDSILS